MRRILLPLTIFALLAAVPGTVVAREKPREPLAGRIDLVLALDTSGSMEGLLESARDKFWAVVTEISRARPEPDLRVGLITYGGRGHAAQRNVVLANQLTHDFDAVADAVNNVPIIGGIEFVGGALDMAITRMKWRPGALKIVFVAGNEGADQDEQISVYDAAKRAVAAGILVNTVYCGGNDDVIAQGWKQVAKMGEGTFANIDQNRGTVHVASPFDDKLLKLSTRMNATYRFYGAQRAERSDKQRAGDDRAVAAGAPVAAERAAAKATKQYGRVGDLVRAAEAKNFDWKGVKDADLPKDLRGLTRAELKQKLAALRAERAAFTKQIEELSIQRRAFVAAERARRKLDDKDALDRVLRDAIRGQMQAGGFAFPK